jgi:hypothetical protein
MFTGLKYLEYIFRNRNSKDNNQKIMNETEYVIYNRTQNQTVYNIYLFTYAETVLQMTQGNSMGNIHASQGGLSGLSPFRSDGSQDSQAERLSRMSVGQKQLKGGT